jgi:hypothetical protein
MTTWRKPGGGDASRAGCVTRICSSGRGRFQHTQQADDAVPATHNPTIRARLGTPDKEYVEIEGATHYYVGQPAQLAQCIAALTDGSRRKGLLT